MNCCCPNGNCLLAAQSPTDNVDSQDFRNLSTPQTAFFGGGAVDDVTVAPSSITVCRRYHLPFIITINSELCAIDGPQRTYINCKKADMALYVEDCDEYIADAGETRTVEQAKKTIR